MKSISLLLTFLFFTITATARAGILIEPYAAFMVSGDITESGNARDYEYDYSGTSFGGRLGYSFLGLMFGGEYSLSSTESETSGGYAGEFLGLKDNWKGTHVGAFLGYSFPVLLRVWATYYFNSELQNDDDAGIYTKTGDTFNGSGYSFGVGFTPFPLISINLEYRSFEYDEAEFSAGTTSLPDSSIDVGVLEPKEIYIGVSVPIDLF